MADLLLELFSEEIPSHMQTIAVEELQKRFEKLFADNNIDYSSMDSFATPRRLAIRVSGLPKAQAATDEERKGPKVDAPDMAINGFCKSVGLDKSQLEIREKSGKEFYFAVIKKDAQPVTDILPNILQNILADFPWEKSQRWGGYDLRWIRPLKRILCLLDSKVINFSFGHLESSNITEGHRFLSSGELKITSPKEYEKTLKNNHVLVDVAERKSAITQQMAEIAITNNLSLKPDEKLLNEVTGLVEWPVCLLGEFDKEFLKLPHEVLVLEMRNHQKYFACLDENIKLSNHFIIVANITADDDGKAIVNGNQRVLRARLSDGQFYFDNDNKKKLDSQNGQLKKMVFHAKLGSMADKVERITSLATFLAMFVPHANLDKVSRAATLSKSDLVSGMVGEFPELQGIMGCYLAKAQGEDADVAEAIREHYKPSGAKDELPSNPVSIAVALADRIDSLVGLFAADEKPTGSKDPFALRRAALGVLRIILDNNIRVSLKLVLENAAAKYPKTLFANSSKDEIIQELLEFFAGRLKVIMKDNDISHDVIAACLSKNKSYDLVDTVNRSLAISEFITSDDGANLLSSYRRANNILSKEKTKESSDSDGISGDKINESLLTDVSEKELFINLEKIVNNVNKLLEDEDYKAAQLQISSLRGDIDAFFDNVMVNDENNDIRINRLNLIAKLCNIMENIADFSLIEISA